MSDSKFGIEATIKPEITIRLTEREALALDALAGYGFEAFIENFYKLGTHYMKPYERDLKSLFDKIRGESGIQLFIDRAKDARAVFSGQKQAVTPDHMDRFKAICEENNNLRAKTQANTE